MVALTGWTERLQRQEQAGAGQQDTALRHLPSSSQLLHPQLAIQPLLLPLPTHSPAVVLVPHCPSFPSWLEEHNWGVGKVKLVVLCAPWSRTPSPQAHTGKDEGCCLVSHPALSNAWLWFQSAKMPSPLCSRKLCCKPSSQHLPGAEQPSSDQAPWWHTGHLHALPRKLPRNCFLHQDTR